MEGVLGCVVVDSQQLAALREPSYGERAQPGGASAVDVRLNGVERQPNPIHTVKIKHRLAPSSHYLAY